MDQTPEDQSTQAAERAPRQLVTASRSSSFYQYYHRQRLWFCGVLAVVVILGMVVGLVFIAHHNYHSWGGQGFLKVRSLSLAMVQETSSNQLPFRKVVSQIYDADDLEESGMKRTPKNVPFYQCGDQQHDCGAFDQPNICCPAGMTCQSTESTTSGILCCNSTSLNQPCQPDHSHPPQCPESTFECAYVVGGGCCPADSQCSPNGCVEFDGNGMPSPITSTFTSTFTSTLASDVLSSAWSSGPTNEKPSVVTLTSTGTMIVGGAVTPTATSVKDGEVAQKGEGAQAAKSEIGPEAFSHPTVGMLVLVAMWMALL